MISSCGFIISIDISVEINEFLGGECNLLPSVNQKEDLILIAFFDRQNVKLHVHSTESPKCGENGLKSLSFESFNVNKEHLLRV